MMLISSSEVNRSMKEESLTVLIRILNTYHAAGMSRRQAPNLIFVPNKKSNIELS